MQLCIPQHGPWAPLCSPGPDGFWEGFGDSERNLIQTLCNCTKKDPGGGGVNVGGRRSHGSRFSSAQGNRLDREKKRKLKGNAADVEGWVKNRSRDDGKTRRANKELLPPPF